MERKAFKNLKLLAALAVALCLLSACGGTSTEDNAVPTAALDKAANNANSAAIEGGDYMTDIKIVVKDKKATPTGAPAIVCGNSDYTATFTFDDEWPLTGVRTARFVYVKDGKVQHEDVPFSGNTVAVPILSDVDFVNVGVFAGELCTTTPARITCERSILCGSGTVHEPTPDVYDQIMALFNEMAEQGAFGATEEQAQQIEQNRQNIVQLTAEKAEQVDVDALEAQVVQHTQSISQLSTEKAEQTDVDVLAARMDTFTSLEEGSTTGDAELADIRVGADGTVYETAGEAVRGQVGDLKSDLSKVEEDISLIINRDIDLPITGYVRTDGTFSPDANAKRTDYTKVSGYDKIVAFGGISEGGYAVAYYDENKNILADISVIGATNNKEITYTIPSEAVYFIYSEYGIRNPYVKLLKDNNLETRIEALEIGTDLPKTDIDISLSAFGSFRKFGIIGDSLSVGHTKNPADGQQYDRNIYYSWGQYLARRYGNTCLNFGWSGISAKSWLGHSKCYDLFIKEENLCQCYIVALGANDAEMFNTVPLGTSSDIGTDNDTFYAYYYKILKEVNNVAPNAFVFVFTLPYPRNQNANVQLVNEAIREICASATLSNIHLIDLSTNYDEVFKSEYITDALVSGHYTAVGYSNIADVNGKIISKYMNDNMETFMSIPFIPYGNNDVIE